MDNLLWIKQIIGVGGKHLDLRPEKNFNLSINKGLFKYFFNKITYIT